MKKIGIVLLILGVNLFIGMMMLVSTTTASGPVSWGYDGSEGPDNWGALSEEYAVCAAGIEQSPINIPVSAPINPADIVFNYQPTAVNILNNGHTIQVNYDEGSSIQIDGKTFNLLQFHFHRVSEHTIGNTAAELEMHLVHASAEGELAVVGVMMNRGSENTVLAPVWDNLPSTETAVATISGASLNIAEALPADRSYYRYAGSLTTPPCTEGVNWFVMANPIELSDTQTAVFDFIFSNNYRPVQPINERDFLISSELTAPEALPDTGGVPLQTAGILLSLGMIITGIGMVAFAGMNKPRSTLA